MTETFVIEGRLMGLNDIIAANRSHRLTGSKAKKLETERVRAFVKAAKLTPRHRPVEIRIEWVEARQQNGAMRDIDNVRAGVKFILDALVEERIIPNDSPRWVRNIYDSYRYNERDPRVIVAVDDYDPRGRHVFHAPITGIGGDG